MSIQVEKKERVVFVRLDRPPLNVLDIALLRELGNILTACAEDATADIVVLQGTGERAFSAGVDIGDHTPDKAAGMLKVVHGGHPPAVVAPSSYHRGHPRSLPRRRL